MAAEAKLCIAALDEKKQDITMLWLLREPHWLEHFRFGMDLLDWARNIMKIPFAVCRSKEFQQEVSREFNERGIRPVAPGRCVESFKKDFAKEKSVNAKWPKPYSPVMLQTRPAEGQEGYGAFVMFSSWQDAMIALRKIAETKNYKGSDGKTYRAEMVYENQVTDMNGYDYPCRIILDCDAKLKEFDNKYTIEELCQSIDQVPEFFTRRLIEIGAIKDTDEIIVYEKEKSRKGKASRHYIFNIVARSTWETQHVLGLIFGAELAKMREAADKAVNAGVEGSAAAAASKKRKKLDDSQAIPEPWQVTDTVPHHGRGQYSVLGFFDSSKGETEYPCITRKWKLVGGKVVSKKPCNVTRAESTLKHKLALQMLHKTCYSCFTDDFVTINEKFMTQKQAKKGPGGGSGAGPSAARGGPRSPSGASPSFLPQWAQSAISRITGRDGGYSLNTTMPCLDPIHEMLSKHVEGIKREDVAHISRAFFCPCLACKGMIKIHENNGTFVAMAEEGKVVYARCSDRSCLCEEGDIKGGCMDVVEGTGARPWIRLTAEKMAELEGQKYLKRPGKG